MLEGEKIVTRTVKRCIIVLLGLIIGLALLSPAVYAATDSSRSYNFQLTVNGGYTATVAVGDEITLEVVLERTDGGKSGSYAMYSMQDEIIYDSTYFSLVESSKSVAGGYDFNVSTMDDGIRKRVILSRLETSSDGVDTPDRLTIASFNLKTLQPVQGISIISKDYKVNSKSADTYITTANDVSVTITGGGPVTYAITFKGGPGATGMPPTMASKAAGESFTLPANTFTREGYTFAGWSDGTKTYAAGATYTMPAHAVTFTAQWTKSPGGSGPGGGGGGGTSAGPVEEDVAPGTSVPVDVEGTVATVVMDNDALSSLLADASDKGTVTMDLSTLGHEVNTVAIPSEALQVIKTVAQEEGNAVAGLKVVLSTGEVVLDNGALATVSDMAGAGTVNFVVEKAANLTAEQKAVVKDKPVYDIRIETDQGSVASLNGTITVYLPYELEEGQSASGVVVYYVDSSGNLINMHAQYDPIKKMVYFTTNHLAVFMIDYDQSAVHICPSEGFADVDQSMWYHEAIDFVIEKGLFMGTSETTFEPNIPMNRAMLVTVLWRLEGNPAVSSASSFEDVASNAWYANAVAWASANKIVSGYGSGLFGPNDNITREQMAAILYRYAEYKGHDVTASDNLSAFADAGEVSTWALPGLKWAVAKGLIMGVTRTILEPRGTATRAQVATVLMRFLEGAAK